jgi:hypothetical protein
MADEKRILAYVIHGSVPQEELRKFLLQHSPSGQGGGVEGSGETPAPRMPMGPGGCGGSGCAAYGPDLVSALKACTYVIVDGGPSYWDCYYENGEHGTGNGPPPGEVWHPPVPWWPKHR